MAALNRPPPGADDYWVGIGEDRCMSDHLVVYEYGTGAIWGYVGAESAAEIAAAVPELDVPDGAPPWLTTEDLEALRRRRIELSDGRVIDRLMHS